MNKTIKIGFLAFVFISAFVFFSWAQCEPQPRLVTVRGEAEVKVVPDEIVFTIGITTLDKDLILAKNQNDELVKKVMALAKEYKIMPKDIQTDYINIRPRYEHEYERRNFIGYFVENRIAFTLKDTSKFEGFLSDILKAGVTYIYGIDFRTTELRKFRDQARALAIKAAREKAAALVAELGQKLGRPYSIKEDAAEDWLYRAGSQMMQNVVRDSSDTSSDADSGIALGQINIKAKVSVSFELE